MAGQIKCDNVVFVTQSFDLLVPIGEVMTHCMDKNNGLCFIHACLHPV